MTGSEKLLKVLYLKHIAQHRHAQETIATANSFSIGKCLLLYHCSAQKLCGLPALQHCSADGPSLGHLWCSESCHRYFQAQKSTDPKTCELKLKKKNAHMVISEVLYHLKENWSISALILVFVLVYLY